VSVIGTGAYGRALDALSARGPGRMVPDLGRITELVALLGDPQHATRVVHVTGTNGKGSVVRMVSAILEACGLRTGTYVSPHLHDVRERIMVGLRPVSPETFAEVHGEVEPLAQLLDARARARDGEDAHAVTFFELTTAMALAHFAAEAVDVAVVEVGLGGRWDATNVVHADVAVISDVDLDHTELLGATAADIAREKVGIVKQGSAVVSAQQSPEVAAVISAAVEDHGGTLQVAGEDLVLVVTELTGAGQRVSVEVQGRRIDDLLLPLRGAHQARNLVLALGAVAALLGPSFAKVTDDVLRAGVAAVRAPGRLEVVREDPVVVVDGAHNPHAARALAAAVTASFRFRDVILVIGCLDDKDVEGIVAALAPIVSHVVVTPAPSERATDVERLRLAAVAACGPRGVHVEVATDVAHALELATSIVGPADGVLVTGSLTTVAAARAVLLPNDGVEGEVLDVGGAATTDPFGDDGLRTLLVDVDGDGPDDDGGEDGAGHDGGGTQAEDDGEDDGRARGWTP
jgi:dihydrofolate synthase / folylpolyglutamate synthase